MNQSALNRDSVALWSGNRTRDHHFFSSTLSPFGEHKSVTVCPMHLKGSPEREETGGATTFVSSSSSNDPFGLTNRPVAGRRVYFLFSTLGRKVDSLFTTFPALET